MERQIAIDKIFDQLITEIDELWRELGALEVRLNDIDREIKNVKVMLEVVRR
jgi:hypothetical protein